jgi:hypothetical protein
MNKTQAIKHARSQVSDLYPFGGGWKYSVFSPAMNAWMESHPMSYWAALASRRAALIHAAMDALHPLEDPDDYGQPWHRSDYVGGTWQSYVKP